MIAADSELITILTHLDLSVAFDTILITILFHTLYALGIFSTPIHWFQSYFSGLMQFIQLKSIKSNPSTVSSGVAQGSLLGSLSFITYLLAICNIFHKFYIKFHCFTDNTQLCLSSKPDVSLPLSSLTSCQSEINN